MKHLCEDIWEDIVSRLSAKDVIRSMLVQKSWYNRIKSYISNPNFAKNHMQKQKLHTQSCLIFCPKRAHCRSKPLKGIKKARVTIFNVEDINDSASYDANCLEPLRERFEIKGSHCNGILCMANYSFSPIMLFNPTTKDLKVIETELDHDVVINVERIGFGYDPISDVYKVVRIFSDYRAQVYILGDNNNNWRDIKSTDIVEDWNFDGSRQLYCNGVYYWLDIFAGYGLMICAFDLHDEEFYKIPIPDVFRSWWTWKDLFELNGTIALSLITMNRDRPIEIWRLDGNFASNNKARHEMSSNCWINHLRVCQPEWIVERIVGFLDEDEVLMVERKKVLVAYNLQKKVLVAYNLHRKDFRVIHEIDMEYARVFPIVKSLISVSDLN